MMKINLLQEVTTIHFSYGLPLLTGLLKGSQIIKPLLKLSIGALFTEVYWQPAVEQLINALGSGTQ
jgi:hypothetical protein